MVEVPPLATTPLTVVLPLPSNVVVKFDALLDKFRVPDSVRVPPEILFVIERVAVSVNVPLSSMLLEPAKVVVATTIGARKRIRDRIRTAQVGRCRNRSQIRGYGTRSESRFVA